MEVKLASAGEGETKDIAAKAVEGLNGKLVGGATLPFRCLFLNAFVLDIKFFLESITTGTE